MTAVAEIAHVSYDTLCLGHGPPLTDEDLRTVLRTIGYRILKLRVCRGVLVENQGSICLARPTAPRTMRECYGGALAGLQAGLLHRHAENRAAPGCVAKPSGGGRSNCAARITCSALPCDRMQ